MIQIMPPWLRRRVGGAVVEGIGVPIETEVDRSTESLRLRFPNKDVEEALGYLGRERRILRGPGESGSTFAIRLRKWWDSHRTRGNAHALLTQLHDFLLSSNNVPVQYIANSGTTVTIDAAGVISPVTEIPTWTGDGEYPSKWARFFLVFYFDGDTLAVPLLDEDGDPILTESGEQILTTVSLFALTPADVELLCAVPREWSAAHIDRIYLVLVPAGGYAWGIPPGIEWGDVGKTWGGGLTPAIITC